MPAPRRLRHGRRQGDDRRPPPGTLGDPHGRAGLARRDEGEPDLLASAHRRSLEVAHQLGARTIAFPAISCGIYGYPVELAAPVAVGVASEHEQAFETIRFVFLEERLRGTFEGAR